MTKRESKKKYLIILLIVLLLALAVGYAAFTDVLKISGTANVNGSFDLKFIVDGTTPANGCYVKSHPGCTATVSLAADSGDADDKLVVTVTDLAYPGAGADIQAVIKNVGTIPAKIKSVTATPTGSDSGNGNAIVISGLDQITTSHNTVAANGTCTFDFTVMWDPDVTELDTTKLGENNNTFSFELAIEYEQDTTNLDVTTTHSDVNP